MPRVLIVDDDPQVLELLQRAAEGSGHEVLATESGACARQWIADRAFDIAVVDVLLQEVDGLALLRDLRSTRPEVRAIAISGGGQVPAERYLGTASVLGAERTLRKPFSMKGFQAALAGA